MPRWPTCEASKILACTCFPIQHHIEHCIGRELNMLVKWLKNDCL